MRSLFVPISNVQLRVVVVPSFAPECDLPVEGFECTTSKRLGILVMLRNPESGEGGTAISSMAPSERFPVLRELFERNAE